MREAAGEHCLGCDLGWWIRGSAALVEKERKVILFCWISVKFPRILFPGWFSLPPRMFPVV